ncbi:MAG TPA: hypothetical protein VF486_10180 [Actinomycetes bacterium]
MTDDATQHPVTTRAEQGSASGGWWASPALFAALALIMVGIWQALVGLVALLQSEFYDATRDYPFQFDATAWGWIHLLVGVAVALTGVGLLSGRTWTRVLGIVLAVLSAIANFLFIPYYPIWSMLIIALDVFVIWALAAHGRELDETW